MKKELLLLLGGIILSHTTASAQIVLDPGDLPANGDVIAFSRLDSTQSSTVLPGSAGASQTWNFSALPPGAPDTITFALPSSTPNGSSFPGASLAAIIQQSSTRYEYYTTDAGGMRTYGFDDNPGITVLDQAPYKFPLLAYGQTVTHTLRARFNVISAQTYDALFISYTSTADAWGSLTTPSGTSSVIRIYTTETVYDSSYVNGVGTLNGTSAGYYYEWYEKLLGVPVLEISRGVMADPNFQQVIYVQDLTLSLAQEETQEQVAAWPNPVTGKFFLRNANGFENSGLFIYSLSGGEVKHLAQLSGNQVEVDCTGLPPGIYFYEIRGEEQRSFGRFIKTSE